MDTVKPYISCKFSPFELYRIELRTFLIDFGDIPLFRSLETQILSAISNDSCEWRRSYGRPTKNITFKKAASKLFDPKILEAYKQGKWSVIDQPVLHIFVTECAVNFFLDNETI